MSLFKNIKQKIRTFLDTHITREQIRNLKRTRRLMCQEFDVYLIFDVIEGAKDIKEYYNASVSPLYVALSSEEVLAACMRITYIKHIEHYMTWCAIRGFKPGINEPSWDQYMEDTLDGLNETMSRDFKVIRTSHTLGDFISMYRTFNGAVAVLGLPTETVGEAAEFFERAEIDEDASKAAGHTVLKDIAAEGSESREDPSVWPIYNVFNCHDVGEYFGKTTLFSLEEYLGDAKRGIPGSKQIFALYENLHASDGDLKAVFNSATKTGDAIIKNYKDRFRPEGK